VSVRPASTSLRNDLELLCAVLIWSFNVTVVKIGLGEVAPLAYNLVRFTCASVVLLLVARLGEGTLRFERRDLGSLVLLGLVGHTVYQICFIEGVARTTASSTSLLFGSSPVLIALISRLVGHERVGLKGAAGALLGFLGVYLIVGGAEPASGSSRISGGPELAGDLLIVAAVACWAAYTVMARGLLRRYSPLRLTALSLSFGTALLVPIALPSAVRQDWRSVSGLTWAGLLYSFLFALVVSYLIWYRSVKRVGNLRTAVYSNLVPVFGTMFGVILLHERLTPGLGVGASCILAGILLTRTAS
jgi:drug/metabolite transporter (DMT)-like permease